jgi:hypothetical protein
VSPISDTICRVVQARSAVAVESGRVDQREYHLIVLLACAAVLAASVVLQPHEQGLSLLGYRWPFYCWTHETLGIRCALCGMSRSFCSLAHGDLGASFEFHRLGPFLFAFFCLQIPYRLYALAIAPRTIDRRVAKVHRGLAIGLCAAIACNWLVYLEGLIV